MAGWPLPSVGLPVSWPAAQGYWCFEVAVLACWVRAVGCLLQAMMWRRMGVPELCLEPGQWEEDPWPKPPAFPGIRLCFHRVHLVLAFVILRNPGVFLSYPV
jgi:hypothetical protein